MSSLRWPLGVSLWREAWWCADNKNEAEALIGNRLELQLLHNKIWFKGEQRWKLILKIMKCLHCYEIKTWNQAVCSAQISLLNEAKQRSRLQSPNMKINKWFLIFVSQKLGSPRLPPLLTILPVSRRQFSCDQKNDQTEKLMAAIWHEMNADRRGEGGAKSAARDWFIPNIPSE